MSRLVCIRLQEESLLPSACINNYFPTWCKRCYSIWGRWQKQHYNVASALSTYSVASVRIICCQGKSYVMRWEYNLTSHLVRNESYQAYVFVMFTFPNRGNTLDFFSPSGLISSLWRSVFFIVISVCPLSESLTDKSDSFAFLWKRANECQQTRSHHFSSKESKTKMQKCCECKIESVTFRTAHFWQFCLPKEYSYIDESSEIRCSVYKVMFIQYFSITSDFRGHYLNRILYLHVNVNSSLLI